MESIQIKHPDPNWAELPGDVVEILSRKIGSISDFFAFRKVCRPWRSSSPRIRNDFGPQAPLLLMPYSLSPGEDGYQGLQSRRDSGIYLFYDPWESKMCKRELNNTVGKMCCASYDGWLVFLAPQGQEVLLVNPVTGSHIPLPPFDTARYFVARDQFEQADLKEWFLLKYMDQYAISKLVFSSNLSDNNCLIIVFIPKISRIFFCQVNDQQWTMVNAHHDPPNLLIHDKYVDATYHNRRFYLISNDNTLTFYDLNEPERPQIVAFPLNWNSVRKMFLERTSGIYLVVIREIEQEQNGEDAAAQEIQVNPTKRYELYQLEEQTMTLQQVTDVRKECIFYGNDSHFLKVSTDDWPELVEKSVYAERLCAFSGGSGELAYNIYVINMDTGNTELKVHGLSPRPPLFPKPPAMWFQPSLQ